MGTATLAAGLAALTASAPPYTLTYRDGYFLLRDDHTTDTVPLNSPRVIPQKAVMFRRDQTFAVWDKRGITLRVGRKVWSTHLTDIAVTRKLFSRDQILQTVDLLRTGTRHKEATALVGAVRVGLEAFFLVQWDDSSGDPWLEALVAVDLASPSPEPKLIGRFDGFSTARAFINDDLFLMKGRLTVATRRARDWGLADFLPMSNQFEFISMGDQLLTWMPPRYYTEQRAYGTIVGGEVEERTMSAQPLFEDRGTAEWADPLSPPLAIIKQQTSFVIRNGITGTESPIPADLGVGRSKFGVLLWTPKERPSEATLYDPDRWTVLAKWPAVGATLPVPAEPARQTR